MRQIAQLFIVSRVAYWRRYTSFGGYSRTLKRLPLEVMTVANYIDSKVLMESNQIENVFCFITYFVSKIRTDCILCYFRHVIAVNQYARFMLSVRQVTFTRIYYSYK